LGDHPRLAALRSASRHRRKVNQPMVDRKGDPAKQPGECTIRSNGRCPNLHESSSLTDMDGETYHCDVCGEHYRLYYEDMA
jgi:hypothetical protein